MPETNLANAEALRSLAASLGYYVDSVEGLRQHRGEASNQIFLRGYYQAGDGAEGFFIWNGTSLRPDDGGTVIAPSNGSDAGRWIRMTRGQPVTPFWWGAKFDDATDDTGAIQAAIDFAVATGGNVLLPPGTAKITRTLVLTAGTKGPHSGFSFGGRGKFGDNGASMRDGSGTLLKYYGAPESADAILNVDRSLWRYTTVSDVSLLCVTPLACKYGILFGSTEFSQHVVNNVSVGHVKIAYAILGGTGGNGEFTYFTNCSANRVEGFFYINSGQAFTQRFEHCNCGLLPGGIYFNLDIIGGISPGGGLIVTDFNATGDTVGDPHPPTNTTLFRSAQSIPPVSFSGGRVEHLTRLIDLGSDFVGVTLSMRNLDLTVDCDPELPSNTTGAFIRVQNNPALISIGDCQITGSKSREVFGIDLTQSPDYSPLIRVTRCTLGNFVAPPRIMAARHDTMGSVKFTDCRLVSTFKQPVRGGRLGSGRKQPLNLEWGAVEALEALRSRSLSSASALAVSGRPSNSLGAPAFCAFSGSLEPRSVPDAPWSAIGAPNDIVIACGDQTEEKLRNSSPWARIVTLRPGAGLYQDFPRANLASDEGTTRYFYSPVHEIYYQSLLRWVSGKGALRVALENSVSGDVYDEFVLKATSAAPSGPHLVSLLARVPPLNQQSQFRLKLHNIDSVDPVTAHMAWQFASPKLDASFVGIDGVADLTDEWSISAETLRSWGRFMLPYKGDGFGSAAAHPLKDLYSDQYMSADDGRLTYFAGDRWCKAPRTLYGGGPPDQGAWRVGDQLLNEAPGSGAYVGWVCVTAGSPGEWRPFGLIA